MTTKLPWIPFGTWYMAAVVCALGCEPDQFVSMGSDGQNWDGGDRVSTAGNSGTAVPESPAQSQLDEPSPDPRSSSCAACGASICGLASSPSTTPGASTGGSNGASAAPGDAAGTRGTAGALGAAGTTSEWVSMPLKL